MTLREAKELLKQNDYRVAPLGECGWAINYWLMGEWKQTLCETNADLIKFAKGVDAV